MTRFTGSRPEYLHLNSAPHASTDGVLHMQVTGYLDYDSADYFLAATTQPLETTPGLRHLHLDCAGLTGLDSMGLAMLLMLHRRTAAAEIILHLDNRTPALDRLLDITGTLTYLIPETETAAAELPSDLEAASVDASQSTP
ncbi:STAS domain-containing protein [Streptomyces sp. NPDC095817]|uniref:STAS domain-containing protein n=1 Tax=Streptomyces sp. NPDC095817 TaxID=3155082 RepID=UPI00331AFCEA